MRHSILKILMRMSRNGWLEASVQHAILEMIIYIGSKLVLVGAQEHQPTGFDLSILINSESA